jgi:hypothetical protein
MNPEKGVELIQELLELKEEEALIGWVKKNLNELDDDFFNIVSVIANKGDNPALADFLRKIVPLLKQVVSSLKEETLLSDGDCS